MLDQLEIQAMNLNTLDTLAKGVVIQSISALQDGRRNYLK